MTDGNCCAAGVVDLSQTLGQEENVALRADSARHFITGAAVLIFSAAAIGTAMRYQDTRPASDLTLAAELPARQATAAARSPLGSAWLPRRNPRLRLGHRREARRNGGVRRQRSRGIASANRGNSRAGNAGSAAWWARRPPPPDADILPQPRRRGIDFDAGVGVWRLGRSARHPTGTAAAVRAPRATQGGNGGGSGNNSGGGGGGSAVPAAPAAPVFGDHTPSVGDLVGGASRHASTMAAPGRRRWRLRSWRPGALAEPASLLLMATGVTGVLGQPDGAVAE